MSQALSNPNAFAASGSADPNELTITLGGASFGGWLSVRVTRGVERMPSDFEIELTERYPGHPALVAIQPFQPCVLKIGRDTVLTGYVDRYMPSIGPDSHRVRLTGRGKCQDIVDCSAVVQGMVVNAPTMSFIANQLAAPFGITATSLVGEVAIVVPNQNVAQFNVNLSETPYEILDRISRYAGVLLYEGTDGNLVIDRIGSASMASGFSQGVNIEAASVAYAADERFSDYTACLMSVDQFSQIAPGGNDLGTVVDQAVPRYRPRVIISEQAVYGQFLAVQRATWEMHRRRGRSQAVRLTCDSWRDSAGTLWQPNATAIVDIPVLKLVKQKWVISEVTFRRDETGTHADLLLMPPEAFSIEPSDAQLYDWQVGQALAQGGAAAQTGSGLGLLGRV